MNTYKIRNIFFQKSNKTIFISTIDEAPSVETPINIAFERPLPSIKPLTASYVVFPLPSQTFMSFKNYEIGGSNPFESRNVA